MPTDREFRKTERAFVVFSLVLISLSSLGFRLLNGSHQPDAVSSESIAASTSHTENTGTDPAVPWPQRVVTYRIANCPSSLDCMLAQAAVRDAVETWDAVSGLSLREVRMRGDIVISWEQDEHGDSQPFDGKGTIAAHASSPHHHGLSALDGDVHFDDAETWVVTAEVEQFPAEVHLPTVALHEIGHALGLRHSETKTALMWRLYEGPRMLTPKDIEAVQAVYGLPGEHEDEYSSDLLAWLLEDW